MILLSVWQKCFDFLPGKPIVVEPAAEQLTSDAGLLPIRQLDERLGWTAQFAAALDDPRSRRQIDHTFLEMARARIYGILASYEDQNDHDTLRSDPLLTHAVAEYERTGAPQRLFCDFWYRAESWPAQRRVVVKVEVNAQGTNRRAVVTNRPGVFVLPGAVYEAYADRGESENRNKELKTSLAADRLSDHRYLANLFRLYLHTQAYNLLLRLRRLVADPPAPPRVEPDLPLEARTPREKRRDFNQRRERDPLGEGQCPAPGRRG